LGLAFSHAAFWLRASLTIWRVKNMKNGRFEPIAVNQKAFAAIGDEVARQYAAGEFASDWDVLVPREIGIDIKGAPITADLPRAVFKVGTLTLRCPCTPEDVAALVARYRKGWQRRMGNGTGALPNERSAWAPGTGLQPYEIETVED
jgi:hypothetical protein